MITQPSTKQRISFPRLAVIVAMSTFSLCDSSDGISRSISEIPPTHYTLKLDSFSLLLKNSIEKYESREFEAGGYRWNLVVYPNGNKSRNVKEHLSLYLAMASSNCLQKSWEVYAVVRLFMLDQNNDNYLILQDVAGKERRFHGMKRELGFDHFVPLKNLNDDSNGFLMNDTCVLGAEVFVCKERAKDQGECLKMIKDPIAYKHTFKFENYSKMGAESIDSTEFFSGDQRWTIKFCPIGKGPGLGTHISVYLVLFDPENLPPGGKIYVEYTLLVLNQVNANHVSGKATNWFGTKGEQHGWASYMTLAKFKNLGYLLKDTCIIQAEVTIHGITDNL